MYTLLLGLVLALPARTTVAPRPNDAAAAPDTLTCTLTGGHKANRRCAVSVPARRAVAACSSADRAAQRCATHGRESHAAWVTSAKGAKCKISAKHSDFKRKVTLSMSKKTAKTAGASCALYVVVR